MTTGAISATAVSTTATNVSENTLGISWPPGLEGSVQWFLYGGFFFLLSLAVVAAIFAVRGYFAIKKYDPNWDSIYDELNKRYKAIADLKKERCLPAALAHKEDNIPFQISPNDFADNQTKHGTKHPVNTRMMLIDIIIEKAQRKLSDRSASYFASGIFLFIFSGTVVLMLATFLFYNTELSYRISYHLLNETPTFAECMDAATKHPEAFVRELDGHKDAVIPGLVCYEKHKAEIRLFPESYKHAQWFVFVIELVKRISAGGAVLGMAYIIAATANSCFRESTILLHRRHLLRYIRLMSYEKDGKIDQKDLRDIFGVDQAARTGFDNVKTESLKDNLVSKLIEAIGRVGGNVSPVKDKNPYTSGS